MRLEKYLTQELKTFFTVKNSYLTSLEEANIFLKDYCGIIDFFRAKEELDTVKNSIEVQLNEVEEPNRRAYGDFQTNEHLALKVMEQIKELDFSPEFVLEPTCGKGIFLVNSLKTYHEIEQLIGIEIYYPYILETKFSILHLFITGKAKCKPKIKIIHANIFDFSFQKLSKTTQKLKTLIIGNPPWVTNSELGSIASQNLPKKSNFKNYSGIEAITGKGNFDIGEYISLMMLKSFHQHHGFMAFLVKNAVVKNILTGQKKQQFKIGQIEKLNIDAKKEFRVSVNACLFQVKLNQIPSYTCLEKDFYSKEQQTTFGWSDDKFVYSVQRYQKVKEIDGKSPVVWRQGVKHDCSKIMELKHFNGHFINGLKEEVVLENDLLYGLLKSSDLKRINVDTYRKTTIITQQKIGQDTSFIKRDYPKTYAYLDKNRSHFDKRKSIIYKNKPPFSIFGIGKYSFAKYKVAIAGMYKKTVFSLVFPEKEKPLMLDDTCYFIGFEKLKNAQIAQALLNSIFVQDFLASIIFFGAKRAITKEILMRIDLRKTAEIYLKKNNWKAENNFTKEDLLLFTRQFLKPKSTRQLQLF